MKTITNAAFNLKLFLVCTAFICVTSLLVALKIPYIGLLSGYLFLTFLPGLLILYCFKLNQLALSLRIVLAVGLSVAFSMFFGFIVNSSLLAIGYAIPLSTVPLLISFSLANLVLAVIAAFRNREATIFSDWAVSLSTGEKLLLLMPAFFPLMSILGAREMNFQSNNTLLMVLLFLIPAYIILVSIMNRKVSEKVYPGLLLLISLSLLLMYSLRSNHIIGADTHTEYYTFRVILENFRWQATGLVGHAGGYQEVLMSVSILPVVYQTYLNIDPEYLFKVIYSLILFFIPLAVYLIARKYLSAFYCFLAAVFFLSNTVFLWTPSDIRSNTAIFFFALAMFTLLSDALSPLSKKAFLIIFMAASVVSHYSSTYVFFFIILVGWLLMSLSSRIFLRSAKIREGEALDSQAGNQKGSGQQVTLRIVILFFALFFFWYSQITGVSFTDGVNFIRLTFTKLGELFLLGLRAPGLAEAFGRVPAYYEAWLLRTEVIFSWLTILLIVIGVVVVLWQFRPGHSFVSEKKEERVFRITRFDADYLWLTIGTVIMLGISVALPYIAEGYGVSRQHLLAMAILAPFLVIGGVMVGKIIKLGSLVVLLVLLPYFMCTSGVTYQIFSYPKAIVLNDAGVAYDTMYVHDEESLALKWLEEKGDEKQVIFSERSRLVVSQSLNPIAQIHPLIRVLQNNEKLDGYVYLRYLNTVSGQYIDSDQLKHDISSDWADLIEQKGKIYANTGSQVFR